MIQKFLDFFRKGLYYFLDTLVPLFKFRIFCPSSTTNSSSKTVTPLVAQSSGSSLSSIPHTGMNNEVAAELGMVALD